MWQRMPRLTALLLGPGAASTRRVPRCPPSVLLVPTGAGSRGHGLRTSAGGFRRPLKESFCPPSSWHELLLLTTSPPRLDSDACPSPSISRGSVHSSAELQGFCLEGSGGTDVQQAGALSKTRAHRRGRGACPAPGTGRKKASRVGGHPYRPSHSRDSAPRWAP